MQSLSLEQKAKDESNELSISWGRGAFNFLMNRTEERCQLKANKKRRSGIERKTGLSFPCLTDEMLLALYSVACKQYLKSCKSRYGLTSGFYSTASERLTRKSINYILSKNSKLKHLEIYPSLKNSKDLPANFKMVIGSYMPDFLIFGLKVKGCSAIALEINGDSHIQKWAKDDLRSRHLKELNIVTIDIENGQAGDIEYLSKAFLEMYRLRNGSFNAQIKRTKRMIWVKTIACHLSLDEVESIIFNKFQIDLNLKTECNALLKLANCPRNIKREILF